jgi:hypothetical protein
MRSLATTGKSPFVAGVLGLLFPGLGHFYVGRRDKALFFAGSILLGLVIGLALSEFQAIHWEKHPYHFLAQVWGGLPPILVGFLTQDLRVEHRIPYFDMGVLYTSASGLLNLIAVLDATVLAYRGTEAADAR